MTEKEKQAKLQYLLNSLSMTKEQKDIVVDLVNSSGSGAPAKDVISIKTDNEGNNLVVCRNDIEIASFNSEGIYDEQAGITIHKSNEMFDFFNNIFNNDFVISNNFTYDDFGDTQMIFNVITKVKTDVAIGFAFINSMNAVSNLAIQKEQ